MSYGITRSQVRALEVFSGFPEMTEKSFVASLAVVKPKTARKTLRKLISGDLVKESVIAGEKAYSLTDEGQDTLRRKIWRCVYCSKDFFDKRRRPNEESCRACDQQHRICKRCFKKLVMVIGEFPTWKAMLRNCPGGAVLDEKKEVAQASSQDGSAP
jgi:Mn-dependent DtxR family transcriptional regulator